MFAGTSTFVLIYILVGVKYPIFLCDARRLHIIYEITADYGKRDSDAVELSSDLYMLSYIFFHKCVCILCAKFNFQLEFWITLSHAIINYLWVYKPFLKLHTNLTKYVYLPTCNSSLEVIVYLNLFYCNKKVKEECTMNFMFIIQCCLFICVRHFD